MLNMPQPVLMQVGSILGGSGGVAGGAALGWISLDGREVFQIAAPQPALANRRESVQDNLERIRDRYLEQAGDGILITTKPEAETQAMMVYVNGMFLSTITEEDARLQGTIVPALLENLKTEVRTTLQRAKRQRQPAYMTRAAWQSAIVVLGTLIAAAVLHWSSNGLINWGLVQLNQKTDAQTSRDRQRRHLRSIQQLVLPCVEAGLVLATALWSLGRFPQTQVLRGTVLNWVRVPAVILTIVLIAYVGVRLSYLLIDELLERLRDRDGFNLESNRRLALRVSTISSVVKNITNFLWLGAGTLIALAIFGIDLGILLASFGIIGLAVSLAMQNLIKGAVTGFFILLEDQYAIGDIVKIGEDSGLVENMNLRITQLRDSEGRLITIPTSDITRVANYSLHWSRCDLEIPVSYDANVDEMLDLIRRVGQEMQQEPLWNELILEDPEILGVEAFADSSVIIRVWIKTQPLKQWDVSREFRRRFKLAMQEHSSSIPYPQRDLHIKGLEDFQEGFEQIRQLATVQAGTVETERNGSRNGNGNGNGNRTNGARNGDGGDLAIHASHRKTDAQPLNASGEASDGDGDADAGQ